MGKEENYVQQNRIQEGPHISDPCTVTTIDPLCSPYVHACSSPTH